MREAVKVRAKGSAMQSIGVYVAESAACGLFAASIATDLRSRQIPNAVPVLLLVFFALYAATGGAGPTDALWQHFAVGGAVLAAGFLLYLTGRFGAGDSKLLAVAGVWIGPSLANLTLFLCSLAVCAFALSVVAMLPFAKIRRLRAELPFALAIAPPAIGVVGLRALSDGI